MRKEDFPVGRTLITITLYLFKHEGLLSRFFTIFFQKISAINVINAAVIPQPMTTYTPNILGKSIRFWDSAAKRKKERKGGRRWKKKEIRVFDQKWSQDGWILAKPFLFWTERNSRWVKREKERGQYPSILTEHSRKLRYHSNFQGVIITTLVGLI